jgi:hypothetical protein
VDRFAIFRYRCVTDGGETYMTMIGFDAYSVVVRRKRKHDDLNFGLYDGKNSLRKVLLGLMKKDLNQFHDEVDYARCWQLDKMQDDGDCIHGILLAGEYGRSHPLVNAKSGKKAYHRTETDAPLEPFTFRMYLPDNKRAGILLSQRFGQAGILATIKSMLRDIMDAASPGYILVIRPLMPEKALKALLQKSKLASLRFTQDVISADIVERIDGRKQIQEGEVEIAIRPKRNGNLKTNYLVELLNGKKKVTDLIEFEDYHKLWKDRQSQGFL